jgi:hypothetical protein
MTSRNVSTNIRLWVDANLNSFSYFRWELINASFYDLKFNVGIQTPNQKIFVINLGHHKVVVCDATFGTNDKKI